MEEFHKAATSKTKTSENAQSSKKFKRNNSPVTGNDIVAGCSVKQTYKNEEDIMDVWVKPEIVWDQEEQTSFEDSVNDDVDDAEDDEEIFNSNSVTDPNLITVDPLGEFVLSDDVPSVNETNKVKLLEQQLEMCNARNLELEKIVHQQKYEIEMLRTQQQNCGYCSKGLSKKKNDNPEVRTNYDFDENVTICAVCKKDLTTIKRKPDRIRHLRACKDGSKFKCPYCVLTYTRKHDLMKHFKKCAIKK